MYKRKKISDWVRSFCSSSITTNLEWNVDEGLLDLFIDPTVDTIIHYIVIVRLNK